MIGGYIGGFAVGGTVGGEISEERCEGGYAGYEDLWESRYSVKSLGALNQVQIRASIVDSLCGGESHLRQDSTRR